MDSTTLVTLQAATLIIKINMYVDAITETNTAEGVSILGIKLAEVEKDLDAWMEDFLFKLSAIDQAKTVKPNNIREFE